MPEQSSQAQADDGRCGIHQEEGPVGVCAGGIGSLPVAPLSPGSGSFHSVPTGENPGYDNDRIADWLYRYFHWFEVDKATPWGYLVRVASPPLGKRDGALPGVHSIANGGP